MLTAGWPLLSAVVLFPFGALAQDDPLVSTALDCSKPGMTCRYWEPVNYDPAKKYPLIVYLHGAGESGTDAKHVSYFAGVLHSLFDQDTGQPDGEYFIMAPQCNCDLETQRWVNWPWEQGAYSLAQIPESQALQQARSLMDGLRDQYSIDAERLYAVGVSMGGFGAWDLIARHPNLFAAGGPVAGGGPPDAAPGMRGMAVWSSHNADDGAVPVSGDRDMFLALARAGARPTYTEGVTGGHSDGGHATGQNFRPWLLAQRRGKPGTSPPEMKFEPEGGPVQPGSTVVLSTEIEGGLIRYTLDGSLPSATAGLEYTGPISLDASAVLIAVAYDSEQLVYHAAPFDTGDGGPDLTDGGAPPGGTPVSGDGSGGTLPDNGERNASPSSDSGCTWSPARRPPLGAAAALGVLLAMAYRQLRGGRRSRAAHRAGA
jgi:predicted esterase